MKTVILVMKTYVKTVIEVAENFCDDGNFVHKNPM